MEVEENARKAHHGHSHIRKRMDKPIIAADYRALRSWQRPGLPRHFIIVIMHL